MPRYYLIDTSEGQVRLPSVTTILDATMPISDRFRLEQARALKPTSFIQKQQAGRDRGNYIHRYASAFLQGRRIGHGQYSRWLRHLDPLLKAMVDVNPGPVACDERVYDLELGYAGTFDFLLRIPGEGDRLCLCDLKTCTYKAWPVAIHSAQLQAAAYAYAWNQQTVALRAEAIASIHVSPYGLTLITNDADAMAESFAEFRDRLHWFGVMSAERQAASEELLFSDG